MEQIFPKWNKTYFHFNKSVWSQKYFLFLLTCLTFIYLRLTLDLPFNYWTLNQWSHWWRQIQIFGRNIGGKKWVTIWIKFEVFSCIKQCRIQKCFSIVSTVRVPEKNAQKILPTFTPCIFYGKTKWKSLQILRNKNLFKVHRYYFLDASSNLNGAERRGKGGYHCTIHSLTSTMGMLKKASGCGTVKKFIRLGLDPTMGLTSLFWTTVTEATRLRKKPGHVIPRHCPWRLK